MCWRLSSNQRQLLISVTDELSAIFRFFKGSHSTNILQKKYITKESERQSFRNVYQKGWRQRKIQNMPSERLSKRKQ